VVGKLRGLDPTTTLIMHNSSRTLSIGFVLCSAAVGGAHAAAPQAADSSQELSEVVVTGRAGVDQRTREETSYSLTTISEEKLRMQAPTSVTESLKSVPGFWVEASGGEASGNVRARGIPVDGFGSVTLLEDGMPVQHDPALGYLNGDQAFRLDETIERIEVVRGGPSSILYSNAPAGVVNYIRRQVRDVPGGTFKYTAGDHGLNRADAWYGTPIGEWKFGIGGFYRLDDGIRDPGFDADKGGQVRMSLSRELENGGISFDVKHLDDTVALYLGIPMRTDTDGKIRAVPGFDGNYGTVAGPETAHVRMKTGSGADYEFDNTLGTDVRRTQATAKIDLQFGDRFTFTDQLRFNDTDTQRNGVFPNTLQGATKFLQSSSNLLTTFPGTASLQLRYANSPGTVFDVANQNGNGLMVVGGLRGVTAPVKEVMNDARLMRKFELGGQSHDVTFGYYIGKADEDFSRYSSLALLDVRDNARLLDLVALNAAGDVVGTLTDHGISRYGYEWEDASGDSTTNAIYATDEWQVTDHLRIDAGVRWERVHVTGDTGLKQTVNLGTPATSQIITGNGQFVHFDQKFDKAGWTIGGNWQFNERSGVFARYTPTFRLPNLSSYITSPTATPITQTMDLGELGYKYASRRFEAYATAFWTKYDNVGFNNYKFDPQQGVSVVQQGYADTRAYGLELESSVYPVEWFDVTVTATLQQPEYRGLRYTELVNNAPVLRDYVGNQLIRVPKTSARIVPALNLLNQRLRLQLAYEYEGKRYVDTANSVVLPHYDVLNASARYAATDHLDVYGYVDNVTNSLGLTEGNPRAGELASDDAGANTFIARPILGRSYRMAVMYRF
jgi:outer membrane receptor protein involved in Fe transport